MEKGLSRPQQNLYLVAGFGLSLMLSSIMVLLVFPAFATADFDSIKRTALHQIQLRPSEILQEIESIVHPTPEPPTAKLSSIVLDPDDDAAPPGPLSVRLAFGGDVNEGRWGDNPDWHKPLVDSFVNLLPLLQEMDLVLFNAEGGLCDPLEDDVVLEPRGRNILWVTPASLIDLQSELGGAKLIVNQANNHTMNLGETCMRHGTAALRAAGIGVLGVGEDLSTARIPSVIAVNETTIGILAYADTNVIIDAWIANADHSGVVPMATDVLEADIRALKPAVDFLIVTIHSGKEFERAVTENQVQFALTAVEHGADFVIGHGAHVPQGVLRVDDTPVYFGLGNGMMDQCFPQGYAFYANDVRKNVWLEVEIRKSELLSVQNHVYYSEECMLPSIASPAIDAEVARAFENILFMEDWPILSSLGFDEFAVDSASDGLVD